MVMNYLQGGAAINCFARVCGVDLRIVDVGVLSPLPANGGLIARRVAAGTRNFCIGPAMTRLETVQAIGVGIEVAEQAVAEDCNLLGFGEMGIGNTTAASVITAALTARPVREVVGRGTGADSITLERKVSVVERALALHSGHLTDPLELLERVGGLEIAAMCGFCLVAAAHRRPVLADGFIATAAAALALRMRPIVRDYLFVAHSSVEPGHRSPKGNRHMRRALNQTANAAARTKGSIFEIVYRRSVPRLGHNQTIGALAHRQCRLIWLILHQGVRYEERGPAVTRQIKAKAHSENDPATPNSRYRIELPNTQHSNPAQGQ
jgi:nicotinate-nucleotide--dimethylbenzimidazole phosphoribosyltransferase